MWMKCIVGKMVGDARWMIYLTPFLSLIFYLYYYSSIYMKDKSLNKNEIKLKGKREIKFSTKSKKDERWKVL